MRENDTKELNTRPSDERPAFLRALAEQHAKRQMAFENYVLGWHATFGLLRRLGIDPFGWQGRLATGLIFMMLSLCLPLIITAVGGQLSVAETARWTVAAATLSVAAGMLYRPYHDVVDNLVSIHRCIADELGLRRLIAWDKRWYNIRVSAPVAGAFALGVLLLLFSIRGPIFIAPVSGGTTVVAFMLLYQVGEMTYAILLLGPESRILGAYKYELYRLSPIDSVAMQRSLRGYNGAVLLNSLTLTAFIIAFVILLPAQPSLLGEIALVLLLMAYLSVGVGLVLPRLAMKRIIQAHKEREVAPLQRRLNDLSARLPELTEHEYDEMKRLKETHDQIRDSSENVLPIGAIAQIAGTLLLPTATFLAAAAGEVYLTELLHRFVP